MLQNPYVLPVTSQPNQTFKTVLPLGERNVELTIGLSFREVPGYRAVSVRQVTVSFACEHHSAHLES